MQNPKHPIWFILFCLVLLVPASYLYSSLAYNNGADLMKDTGLVGVVTALLAAYSKLVNS